MGSKLTSEQKQIVTCDPKPGREKVNVVAYAGTGKTYTLKAFARKHPRDRILYVAFNKSVQKEALDKFPDNTTVKTIHSLAYRAFGSRYSNQLAGGLRLKTIKNVLELNLFQSTLDIRETIHRYFQSKDKNFKPRHVPESEVLTEKKLMEYSLNIFRQMVDRGNREVPMTHDGYLKLYQLSGPDLSYYDIILFDEAQDANPVKREIVLSQPVAQLYVGDPHQQIYRWNGAEDALEQVDEDQTFYLTKSFRFGSEIAGVAESILREYKDLEKSLRGSKKPGRVHREEFGEQVHTRLHRTYAGCFDSAVEALDREGTTRWCGGIENYELQQIADLFYLYDNNRGQIGDELFRNNWQDYEEYSAAASETEDPEMMRLTSIVEKYEDEIPELLKKIKKDSCREEGRETLVISTAHRAKGKQWEKVKLADDFPELKEDKWEDKDLLDEVNILYVAVTRAVKELSICSAVESIIET